MLTSAPLCTNECFGTRITGFVDAHPNISLAKGEVSSIMWRTYK